MNQKGFVQPLLIVIIGVIVLGGGFVVMKNFRTPRRMPPVISPAPPPSPSPTPAPTPTPSPAPPQSARPPSAKQDKPRGIYALDNQGGINRDGGIRNYDFVSGYAWRMAWPDFEKQKNVYDFSALNYIVGKLPSGQKLSMDMLGPGGTEPAYIATTEGVTTWTHTDMNPRHQNTYGVPVKKPVPWDLYLQERFKIFVKALAEHKVGGTSLRDHTVLDHIVVTIPGIGAIREGPGEAAASEITQLPGYSRDKFIDVILSDLQTVADNFPDTPISVPFWSVTDNTKSPPLWEAIHNAIQSKFDGTNNSKIGYFQENLSALKNSNGTIAGGPPPQAMPLARAVGTSFVTFQMLQSWVSPFANPAKTAGTIPTDAIEYAYTTFGATYFEVYVPDLDNKEWHDEFREWSEKLKK